MLWTISACTVPPPSPPSTAPVCARVWLSSLNVAMCARSYNSLQFDAIDCTAWASPAPYLTHWEPSKTAPLVLPHYGHPGQSAVLHSYPQTWLWHPLSSSLLHSLTSRPLNQHLDPSLGTCMLDRLFQFYTFFRVRIGDPPPVLHFPSSQGTCWFDGSSHFGTFFGRDGLGGWRPSNKT